MCGNKGFKPTAHAFTQFGEKFPPLKRFIRLLFKSFVFFTDFNIVRKELSSQIGKISFKRMQIGLKFFGNTFETFTMLLLQSLVGFPFVLAPSPWWNSSGRLPKPYLASARIGLSRLVGVAPL